MSETSAELLALMNGYGLIFETLIRKLSASGLLSQEDMSDELGKPAKRSRSGGKAHTLLPPTDLMSRS